MLNQVVLVGRLTKDIDVNKTDNRNIATISLAIPRNFKNSDGVYDTDFVDCIVFDSVALNVSEYCSMGDIIGVKGRIQSKIVEKDNEKKYLTEIIAEKVTFLSTHTKDEKEGEN